MKPNITRRNFIQRTAVTSGLATIIPVGMSDSLTDPKPEDQNPAPEIWIAGVSQMNLNA
jgi:hypothetical protein